MNPRDNMEKKDKYFILILILLGNFIFSYSIHSSYYPSIFDYGFIFDILYQSGLIIILFLFVSSLWENKLLLIISALFIILLVYRAFDNLIIQNYFGFIFNLGFLILLVWFLSSPIIITAAEFFTEKKKFNQSIRLCDFDINHLGGHYKTHLINGHNFIETNDYEKAIMHFKKCLTYDVDSYGETIIYAELGASYLNIENYEKSLFYYEKIIKTEFDEILPYAIKGRILSLIGLERYSKAKDCIDEGLKKYENDEDILNMKESLKNHLEELNEN